MFRLLRRAVLAVAAFVIIFAAAGCAPMTVSAHFDRLTDFARYRTYDWGPADALPTGDPRLDSDPFFKDHFQGAVERRLAARGWELTPLEPDLLIHYHATTSRRIDVNRIDDQYGYCAGDTCDVHVIDYEAGTLLLDIVDARTNRLVWRGWAQHDMHGIIGNRDGMERMINEAVARMLNQLPRAL